MSTALRFVLFMGVIAAGCTILTDDEWDLHVAAADGLTKRLTKLIKRGSVNMDAQDEHGRTAVWRAASEQKTETLRMLLSAGADVDLKTYKQGVSPLLVSSQVGFAMGVRLLLRHGASVNDADTEHGHTCLHEASRAGHELVVEELLRSGADPLSRTDTGASALYFACDGGYLDIVRLLLQQAGVVEEVHSYTVPGGLGSPFEAAASRGHVDVLKLLIRLETREWRWPFALLASAIQLARKKGFDEAEEILEGHMEQRRSKERIRAEIHASNFRTMANPDVLTLLKSAKAGDSSTVLRLLRAGVPVDSRGSGGHTPLHHASDRGSARLVTELLALNASVELFDNVGATPLMLAAMRGHHTVARLLIQAGADVDLLGPRVVEDTKSMSGCMTALMYAATPGHVHVTQELLNAGANVHFQSPCPAFSGQNALWCATWGDHARTVQLLFEHGATDKPLDGGHSGLQKAAYEGKHATLKAYLMFASGPVQINHQNDAGWTALSVSCSKEDGSDEAVRMLLDSGADTSLTTNGRLDGDAIDGMSALMHAAKNGRADAVRLLIDAGARRMLRSTDGISAAGYARAEGHSHVLKALKGVKKRSERAEPAPEQSAKASQKPHKHRIAVVDGDEPGFEVPDELLAAAMQKDYREVARLLKAGHKDNPLKTRFNMRLNGMTALMYASYSGYIEGTLCALNSP